MGDWSSDVCSSDLPTLRSLIQDDRDYATHVDYIHINPVKHEYVIRAVDWPHSSIHQYIERGWLAADWAVAPDNIGDFGEVEIR